MGLARPLTKAAQADSSQSTSIAGITLGAALDRWYDHLETSERIKSARTIDAYRYGIGFLALHVGEERPLADITTEDIERLLADLKRSGKSAGGRALVFRPIRTFLKWCVARDLLDRSPADKVSAPKASATPVEFVTDDEWAAILKTTEHRTRWAFRARRDRAILLMLATTGARLSEVTGLRVQEVDLVAGTFHVMGKGGKPRTLPLLPDAAEALRAYLTLERPRSPYSASDALWLAPRGPLTANGLAQMVADRGKAAGMTRRVHPHELRHRFTAKALAGGMPDTLVIALTGHSTTSLLVRYGAHTRSEDAMAYLRGMKAS